MVLRRGLFATLESYPVLAVPLGLVMDNKDFMDNWICTAAVATMLNTKFHGRMHDGEVYERSVLRSDKS